MLGRTIERLIGDPALFARFQEHDLISSLRPTRWPVDDKLKLPYEMIVVGLRMIER